MLSYLNILELLWKLHTVHIPKAAQLLKWSPKIAEIAFTMSCGEFWTSVPLASGSAISPFLKPFCTELQLELKTAHTKMQCKYQPPKSVLKKIISDGQSSKLLSISLGSFKQMHGKSVLLSSLESTWGCLDSNIVEAPAMSQAFNNICFNLQGAKELHRCLGLEIESCAAGSGEVCGDPGLVKKPLQSFASSSGLNPLRSPKCSHQAGIESTFDFGPKK